MLYSKTLAKRRQCLNYDECKMIALTDEYCGYCKKKYRLHSTDNNNRKKNRLKQMRDFSLTKIGV